MGPTCPPPDYASDSDIAFCMMKTQKPVDFGNVWSPQNGGTVPPSPPPRHLTDSIDHATNVTSILLGGVIFLLLVLVVIQAIKTRGKHAS